MKPDSNSAVRRVQSSRPSDSPPALLRLPPWWLGSGEKYRPIRDTRIEIRNHDRIMAKNALAMMTGSVLVAVVIYSVDAAGASAVSGSSSAMVAAAVSLLVLTGIWILDRRLAQQFRDARLQALVWNDLVAAVKQGSVDLSAIGAGSPCEAEVDGLLRRELGVVVQYLASQEELELHLPLFEEGITLTKA